MTYEVKQIRNVHIVSGDSALPLKRVTAINEEWLQELIASHPELVPIQTSEDIICIGREVKVGTSSNTGYIDNLYVTASGGIIVVETKLYRNQESRREVVAQILDYAKELQTWDSERLNAVCEDYTYKKSNQAKRIIDVMCDKGFLAYSDESMLIDNINTALQSATFTLMILGDGIRTNVQDISGFLNSFSQMNFDLILAELELYQNGDNLVVVPNLLTKTENINRFVYNVPDNAKLKEAAKSPANPISRKEFIAKFCENIGYDSDELTEILCEIDLIDGVFINTTATELQVCIDIYGKDSFALLHFAVWNSGSEIYLMPGPITNHLEKNGIFPFEADSFLDFYKPYILDKRCKCKPYEKVNNCYFADVIRLLHDSYSLIQAIKEFSGIVLQ